jgi:HSP20 family protein
MTMLNTLKQTGRNIGREINRAWDNLSEGWRELLSRSSHALTHFSRGKELAEPPERVMDIVPPGFPRWSLLAGELEETPRDVVVRVELPGLDKEDCHVSIEGNVLRVSGEKRFERDTQDSTYHVMERAYGAFVRTIALPRNVNADKAEASYRNGVLTVRLPKGGLDKAKAIQVA